MPVTVMDSAGEIEGGDDDQPIQFDPVAFALGDFETHRAVTFAPGRGAMDSQGQPKSQLQNSMYSPSSDHSLIAIVCLLVHH